MAGLKCQGKNNLVMKFANFTQISENKLLTMCCVLMLKLCTPNLDVPDGQSPEGTFHVSHEKSKLYQRPKRLLLEM